MRADVALQSWAAPTVAPDLLARYRKVKPTPGGTYMLADHPELQNEAIAPVFDDFRRRVLNLDAGVREPRVFPTVTSEPEVDPLFTPRQA